MASTTLTGTPLAPRASVAATLVAILLSALFASSADADEGLTLDPSWGEITPAELTLGGLYVAAGFAARYAWDAPPARMTGGILFDDGVRSALRIGSRQGREAAGRASDILWYVAMGTPLLVDSLVVALGVHHSPDVAWKLFWVATESLALSAFLSTLSENFGRQRPMAQGCRQGVDHDGVCGTAEENRSFLSGHTTAAFAGAGLMCASHQHLPLYGGGAPDTLACVGALAVATANATLRVASDNHWATDVLVSAGVGFAAGYLMPSAMHWGFGGGTNAIVMPTGSRSQVGLVMMGTL